MKIKYAYLVFNLPHPFPYPIKPFNFDKTTELKEGDIKDQIEGPDSKHWEEWLGSLTWNRITENKLILSTWTETKTPEILDEENNKLQSKLLSIFRILPLIAPLTPPFEEVFIFSGKGTISANGLLAENIRAFSKVNCWTRSYYNEHHWSEFHEWAKNKVMKPTLLDSWKSVYNNYQKLFINNNNNRQLLECYRSFEEAMKSTQLEFKIPNLVRAIESVVVCKGFKEFADLTLYLTKEPDSLLPYSISTNTKSLLQELYHLRNDCSHGKIFAYSLEKKLGKAPDATIIAKFEFLAEWAARKILTDSFMNTTILQNTKNRDTLVDAWKNQKIQPTH